MWWCAYKKDTDCKLACTISWEDLYLWRGYSIPSRIIYHLHKYYSMCSQKQKQERGVTDCPFLHVIVKIAGGRVPWKLLKQRLVIRISSFITNVSGMQKTTETINIAGCLAVLRRLCSEQSYAQSTAKRTWFGAREVPNGHFLRGSTCQWSSWQPYRVNKEMPLHNKHESVAVMVVVHALTGPRVWFTSVLFRKSLIPFTSHVQIKRRWKTTSSTTRSM